jgi:hypothetical protein
MGCPDGGLAPALDANDEPLPHTLSPTTAMAAAVTMRTQTAVVLLIPTPPFSPLLTIVTKYHVITIE